MLSKEDKRCLVVGIGNPLRSDDGVGPCIVHKIEEKNIPGVNTPDLIARSLGRYGLLAMFSRVGTRVLDFPCGSGYAADFLGKFGVIYEGREFDKATVEYADNVYGNKTSTFKFGDLCHPDLSANEYDLIGCIDGLEHIDKQFQKPLIKTLSKSLKKGGVMIVSSPENTSGKSGHSKNNPYHKWELTKEDFLKLLHSSFSPANVELVTYQAVLSYGAQLTTCFFGICHKEYEKEK